jgi:DNA primase
MKTSSVIGATLTEVTPLYDVETVLDNLGIEYEVQGDNARALCPMHERLTGKIDGHPSWFVHLETGQHHCFSCGYKGGLTGLVCDIKDFYEELWGHREPDIKAAREWLQTSRQAISWDKLKAKLEQKQAPVEEAVKIEESHLAIFTDPPADALAKRNLSEESAKAYGVLWQANKKNWILPLRVAQHETLMGYQIKGSVDRYFRNYPAGVKKSFTLFGFSQKREDVSIIVESPLDCLRLYTAGFKGAMATCGALVSDAQAKLMRGTEKVIVAFDNPNIDAAGRKACIDMQTFSLKYNLNLFYFNYGISNKKDPGDMTDAEIAWGIENAKSVVLGEKAYVYGDFKAVSN